MKCQRTSFQLWFKVYVTRFFAAKKLLMQGFHPKCFKYIQIRFVQNNSWFCIIVYLGMICANSFGHIGIVLSYQIYTQMWLYLTIQIGCSFLQTWLSMTPPILIQIFLEHFKSKCNMKHFDLSLKCATCLNLYEKMAKAFQYFFFYYFLLTQSFAIFYIFSAFSASTLTTESRLGKLISLGSQLLVTICVMAMCTKTTGTVEDSYECLQNMKRQIQEQLSKAPEKAEKIKLKYFHQRIMDTKPINACGYFEIGKSTLTSILSVRYNTLTT